MSIRYVRIAELASRPGRPGMLPVSQATVWRWVRDGKFPKPVKLSDRVTAWPLAAVEEALRAMASGAA